MRQAYIPVALTSTAVLVGLQCTLTADWWMAGLCAMIVVVMIAGRHVGVGDTPPTDVLAISPNTGAIPHAPRRPLVAERVIAGRSAAREEAR